MLFSIRGSIQICGFTIIQDTIYGSWRMPRRGYLLQRGRQNPLYIKGFFLIRYGRTIGGRFAPTMRMPPSSSIMVSIIVIVLLVIERVVGEIKIVSLYYIQPRTSVPCMTHFGNRLFLFAFGKPAFFLAPLFWAEEPVANPFDFFIYLCYSFLCLLSLLPVLCANSKKER